MSIEDFNKDNSDDQQGDTAGALASYSDLFAAISFVFLFVYVVATLGQGVTEVTNQLKIDKIISEQKKKESELIAQYEKRLEIYQTDKEIYFSKLATPSEKKAYQDAIANLQMIENLKKEEKEKLFKQYKTEEEREKAVEEYKQVMKDIVTANLSLKQQYKVAQNNREYLQKNIDILKEKMTANLQKSFDQKLKDLEFEFKAKHSAERKKLDQEKNQFMSVIKQEKEEEIQKTKRIFEQEKINEVNKIKSEYGESKNKFVSEKSKEMQEKLKEINERKQKQIDAIQAKYDNELTQTQKKYDKKEETLANQFMQKQAQFETEINNKLSKLNSEEAKLKSLQSMYQDKAKMAEQNADQKKRTIATKLKNDFANQNLPVEINPMSAEMTLTFGQGYFDFNDYVIKEPMSEILKKVIPHYAKSLLENPAYADHIESVEIIGYSSPIFQNKYVNPEKLDPNNFEGLNYNLDLSYKRARSIYKVIFDTSRFKYKYQQELFVKTHVAGRSYIEGRKPAAEDSQMVDRFEYCEKYKCDEQHKVVIRVNLKD